MNRASLDRLDEKIITAMRRIFPWASRIALFVVFFWFGALKVVGMSPANPLVIELLDRTLPFINANSFIIWFGIFECLIGLIFLVRGLERLAIALLVPHMLMTFGPLVLLPHMAWSMPFVPTLEGQYIIKNLALIALAIGIAAHLKPLDK